MTADELHKPLLERRIPLERIVLGRAYIVFARSGGVGVAVEIDGRLGYRLHRQKWERHYLFTEWDWSIGTSNGTVIPLREIAESPPLDDDELLVWLATTEEEHRDEISAAARVVVPFLP